MDGSAATSGASSPMVTAAAPGAPDVADEVASLNETAKGATKAIIVFLATALYLAVSVAGTDSRQLLLNGTVNFPILNTGIPCWLFYLLAPLLVVILHVYMLLEGYFLSQKIYYLQRHHRATVSELSQSITVFSVAYSLGHPVPFYIRFIFPLLYVVTNVSVPLFLLLSMQAKFLPFHDPWISRLHRSLVAVDLVLIILFFFVRGSGIARAHRLGIAPRQSSAQPASTAPSWREWLTRLRHRVAYWAIVVILAVAVFWLSMFRIVVPETCAGAFDEWFALHHLGRLHVILGTLIATNISAEGQQFDHGINAAARDLRCADFRNATLSGSDFRGALLTDAQFDQAKLNRVTFGRTPENLTDAHGLVPGTRTNLTRASFGSADLADADFSYAQLNLANFKHANLMGTSFNGAKADEADFTEAMGKATFDSASLRGADLFSASLKHSSFARAHLEVANLVGAHLQGADFSGATLVGADMRRSSLQGASGLSLEGVDLTHAHLEGLNFCSPSQDTTQHTLSSGEPSEENTPIGELRNNLDYADLRDAFFDGSCISTEGRTLFYRPQQLLGHTEKLPAGRRLERPAEQLSEDQFYHALAYFLINVKLRNQLLPYLAKAVTTPSDSSRFDVMVACAIMCDREKSLQAGRSDHLDPFVKSPDLIKRLSAIAENCSVLLADPKLPKSGPSPLYDARTSRGLGPICN